MTGIRYRDRRGQGETERTVTLSDVEAIEEALANLKDCRLIVVDPIRSYLGGETDSHRDNNVRAVLAPVARLAERYGPAVLIVTHRRKSAGLVADDLALGSRAFTGIARSVWHLSRDTVDRRRRLLLPGKCNLAAEQTGLAFSIEGDPPRIAWEPEPVTMSADDALAAEQRTASRKPGPKAEERDKAAEWLRDALSNGPRLARELYHQWGGSKQTLQRAANSMNVKRYRETIPGPWLWRLPDSKVTTDPQEKYLGDLDHVGPNSAKDSKITKISTSEESGDLGADRERYRL